MINLNRYLKSRNSLCRRELERKGVFGILQQILPLNLEMFSSTSCTSVHHVIKALSTNSWPLDPMPTRLLKDHLDDIVPTITAVTVCESLLTGVFPTYLKQFLIRPLLKKPDLDKEILKNYRPIPNIPFLAKIIKKRCSSSIIFLLGSK